MGLVVHDGGGHPIRFLLEREDARGPFNLTAPQPLTNRDFGKTLGKADSIKLRFSDVYMKMAAEGAL